MVVRQAGSPQCSLVKLSKILNRRMSTPYGVCRTWAVVAVAGDRSNRLHKQPVNLFAAMCTSSALACGSQLARRAVAVSNASQANTQRLICNTNASSFLTSISPTHSPIVHALASSSAPHCKD